MRHHGMNSIDEATRIEAAMFGRLQRSARTWLGDASREAIGAVVADLRGRIAGMVNESGEPAAASVLRPLVGSLVSDVSIRIQQAQAEFDRHIDERIRFAAGLGHGGETLLSASLLKLAARLAGAIRRADPQQYRRLRSRLHQVAPVHWSGENKNPMAADVIAQSFLAAVADVLATPAQRAVLQPVVLGEVVAILATIVPRINRHLELQANLADPDDVADAMLPVAAEAGSTLTGDSSDARDSSDWCDDLERESGSGLAEVPDVAEHSAALRLRQSDSSAEATTNGSTTTLAHRRIDRQAMADDTRADTVPATAASCALHGLPTAQSFSRSRSRSPDSIVAQLANVASTLDASALSGHAGNKAGTPLRTVRDIKPGAGPEPEAIAFAHSVNTPPFSREARAHYFGGIRRRLTRDGLPAAQIAVVTVVAALFDYAVDNRQLPERTWPLLWRLQKPLLTLALLDDNYLGDSQRSVWSLVESVTAFAQTCRDGVDQASERFRRLEIFVQETERLSATLQRRTRILAAQTTRELKRSANGITRLIEQLDREQAGVRQVPAIRNRRNHRHRPSQDTERAVTGHLRTLIANRFVNRTVPRSVREFVDTVWLRVLRATLLRDGEQSEAFVRASATIDDLLWTLDPDGDPHVREALPRRIPDLIERLAQGMLEVGVDESLYQGFFDELFLIHLANLQKPAGRDFPYARTGATSALPDTGRGAACAMRTGQGRYTRSGGLAPGNPSVSGTRLFDVATGTPVSDTDTDPGAGSRGSKRLLAVLQKTDLDDLPQDPRFFEPDESEAIDGMAPGQWLFYRHRNGQSMFLKLAWINERRTQALLLRSPDRRAGLRRMADLRRLILAARLLIVRPTHQDSSSANRGG